MAVAGRAGAPFGAGLVGRAVVAVAGAEECSEVSLVAEAGFEDCCAEECGEVSLVAVAGFEDGRAEGCSEDGCAEVSSEVSLVAVAGRSLTSFAAELSEATPLAECEQLSELPVFSCQNMRVMRFDHNTASSHRVQQLNIGREQLQIARQHVSSSSNSGPPIPNLVNLCNTVHFVVEIPAVDRAPGRGKGKGKNNNKGKGKAKGKGKPSRGH